MYIYIYIYNIITHPSWFADIPGVTSCKEICSAPVCPARPFMATRASASESM